MLKSNLWCLIAAALIALAITITLNPSDVEAQPVNPVSNGIEIHEIKKRMGNILRRPSIDRKARAELKKLQERMDEIEAMIQDMSDDDCLSALKNPNLSKEAYAELVSVCGKAWSQITTTNIIPEGLTMYLTGNRISKETPILDDNGDIIGFKREYVVNPFAPNQALAIQAGAGSGGGCRKIFMQIPGVKSGSMQRSAGILDIEENCPEPGTPVVGQGAEDQHSAGDLSTDLLIGAGVVTGGYLIGFGGGGLYKGSSAEEGTDGSVTIDAGYGNRVGLVVGGGALVAYTIYMLVKYNKDDEPNKPFIPNYSSNSVIPEDTDDGTPYDIPIQAPAAIGFEIGTW